MELMAAVGLVQLLLDSYNLAKLYFQRVARCAALPMAPSAKTKSWEIAANLNELCVRLDDGPSR
jgi:hypothetical protein